MQIREEWLTVQKWKMQKYKTSYFVMPLFYKLEKLPVMMKE